MRESIIATPLVSVIIPVYKAEKYLEACANGILCQSYPHFELILVDDGSPDGSGAMCDLLAERDKRIKPIHQENGGVSKARNRGLDEAVGEYAVFVDADDLVRPDYLGDLITAKQSLADENDKVLIVSDYQPFNEKGQEERSFPTPFSLNFFAGEGLTAENFRELVFNFRIFPPYCKLYSRGVIEAEHIRFREGMKSAEDFEFNIRYLSAIDRLIYIDSVQYDYRVGYKRYVPSNHGILGESEVISAHIMAHGITNLASRMGILDEVGGEIDLWAANKHYFNRLHMLFAKGDGVAMKERKALYNKLISDSVYYNAARRGARQLPDSRTKQIALKVDCFMAWGLFYKLQSNRGEKH